MNELKILFGINSERHEREIEQILRNKLPNRKITCYSAIYLKAIEDELIEHNPIDFLILAEDLEVSGLTIDWLDNITDKYNDLKIILLSNKTRDNKFIQDAFKIARINNILLDEDVNIENVIDLILNPRTKAEAKDYLSFNDSINIEPDKYEELIEEEQLIKALNLINESETIEELHKNFTTIYELYNEKKLIYLLGFLNDDVKKNLEGDLRFKLLIKKYWEIQKQREEDKREKNALLNIRINKTTKEVTRKEIIKEKKTIKEKEYIYTVPKDYFKVIMITGTAKSGKSLFTNILATYFLKKKAKTVILDLTKERNHYVTNMYAREDYETLPINNLASLYDKNIECTPYILESGVHLFANDLQTPILHENIQEMISYLKRDYNFVFIDVDLNTVVQNKCLYQHSDNIFYFMELNDISKPLIFQTFINFIVENKLRTDNFYPVINKYLPKIVKLKDEYKYLYAKTSDIGKFQDYIIKPKKPIIIHYDLRIEKENMRMLTSTTINNNYSKICKIVYEEIKDIAQIIYPVQEKTSILKRIKDLFNKEVSIEKELINVDYVKDVESNSNN